MRVRTKRFDLLGHNYCQTQMRSTCILPWTLRKVKPN